LKHSEVGVFDATRDGTDTFCRIDVTRDEIHVVTDLDPSAMTELRAGSGLGRRVAGRFGYFLDVQCKLGSREEAIGIGFADQLTVGLYS
jgi:hypothetical protein